MPTDPLSNYLKMYRKRSGLSQPELAFLLGCRDGSKISRYERGRRSPSLDALIALQVVFHGPTEALFVGRYGQVLRELRARAKRLIRRVEAAGAADPRTRRKLTFLVELSKRHHRAA